MAQGKTELKTITIEMARAWLKSTHQRQIDLMKVRSLLIDIEIGNWEVSKQEKTPIIIHKDKCLDGHHRLLAVLMAGHPIINWVEYR